MNKTLKIELEVLNTNKQSYLDNLFSTLDEISVDYLLFKKHQLNTKNYDKELVRAKYQEYRTKYNINSAIVQKHMMNIDDIVYAYIKTCKRKHKLMNFPTSINSFIILRNDLFSIKNTDNKFSQLWLRFSKINFPLKNYNYAIEQLKLSTKLCDSKIIRQNNKYILCLTIEIKEKEHLNFNELGIDIGIVNPITVNTGKFICNGKQYNHKRRESFKKRKLQQKHQDKVADKTSSKQSNYTRNYNHKISKMLINYCISNSIGSIYLEKLNIAVKKYGRKLPFAYGQLLDFIKYKAAINGISIVEVNPHYTSQKCSFCGYIHKENRNNQIFKCLSCGNVLHADVNAARNIYNFSVIDERRDYRSQNCTNLETLTTSTTEVLPLQCGK